MKLIFRLIFLSFLPGKLLAAVVVLNGLTHTHLLNDQNKIQGIITVKNDALKDARILVYRQDLVLQCGQSASYPETKSHSRSIGDGLRTNVDEKILAGNEQYDLRYTVEIPKEKTAPGTYWEIIMVEVADPIRDETKNGVQVNSKVRYAIQIIVDVGNFEGPRLSFENIELEKGIAKNTFLKIQLKNNSSFGVRTNVILEVYDKNGNKLKTTEPNTRMVYPENCNTFEFPLNDLVTGKYDCVIIADTGKDLFGSNISVQIE